MRKYFSSEYLHADSYIDFELADEIYLVLLTATNITIIDH